MYFQIGKIKFQVINRFMYALDRKGNICTLNNIIYTKQSDQVNRKWYKTIKPATFIGKSKIICTAF